jgi:hypothetical protein
MQSAVTLRTFSPSDGKVLVAESGWPHAEQRELAAADHRDPLAGGQAT